MQCRKPSALTCWFFHLVPSEQMAKGDASCEAAGGADAQNRCCANKIVEKTVQDDEFCGKVRAAALCNASSAMMLWSRCMLMHDSQALAGAGTAAACPPPSSNPASSLPPLPSSRVPQLIAATSCANSGNVTAQQACCETKDQLNIMDGYCETVSLVEQTCCCGCMPSAGGAWLTGACSLPMWVGGDGSRSL